YTTTPGPSGSPPGVWPVGSRVEFDSDRDNLVVFFHPRCPCSRATLSQLQRVLARSWSSPPLVTRCYVDPDGVGAGWAHTALWRHATALPGVNVVVDRGQAVARRFGALTSGHALLYDSTGRLVYSGGITAVRGHEGDN